MCVCSGKGCGLCGSGTDIDWSQYIIPADIIIMIEFFQDLFSRRVN